VVVTGVVSVVSVGKAVFTGGAARAVTAGLGAVVLAVCHRRCSGNVPPICGVPVKTQPTTHPPTLHPNHLFSGFSAFGSQYKWLASVCQVLSCPYNPWFGKPKWNHGALELYHYPTDHPSNHYRSWVPHVRRKTVIRPRGLPTVGLHQDERVGILRSEARGGYSSP
jgi:hypothetical protein